MTIRQTNQLMKRLAFLLLCAQHFSVVLAQNETVILEDRVFDATQFVGLSTIDNAYIEDFFIQFVKISNLECKIIFRQETYSCEDYGQTCPPIIGTAILYLEDNSQIKLVDRRKFDCYNNESYSIYTLTRTEVNRIIGSNIKAIRINLTQCINKSVMSQETKVIYNKSYSTSYRSGSFTLDTNTQKMIPPEIRTIVHNQKDFSLLLKNLFNL